MCVSGTTTASRTLSFSRGEFRLQLDDAMFECAFGGVVVACVTAVHGGEGIVRRVRERRFHIVRGPHRTVANGRQRGFPRAFAASRGFCRHHQYGETNDEREHEHDGDATQQSSGSRHAPLGRHCVWRCAVCCAASEDRRRRRHALAVSLTGPPRAVSRQTSTVSHLMGARLRAREMT